MIAYKAGGAFDFIKEGVTGEFFDKQNSDSLAQVLEKFDKVITPKMKYRFLKVFKRKFFKKISEEINEMMEKKIV